MYHGAREDSSTTYRTHRKFFYDLLGRKTLDAVQNTVAMPLASDVDDSILAIGYEYDSEDRLYRVKSYDGSDPATADVENSVTYKYNAEGQLEESTQVHGDSGTWSKAVTYDYTDESGAFPVCRINHIDYPVKGDYRRRVSYTRDTDSEEWEKAGFIISKPADCCSF